jgi:site-specific DNA recombinase
MRVAGYLRVSSDEQVRGFGLDVQRDHVEDFCRQERLELVETYIDPGVSGTTPLEARPGLSAALEDVRSGRVEAVVVARFDRLARDALTALLIERDFQRAGGTILSAEGINGNGPDVKMLRTILHGYAELEKARMVERLREAKRKKAAAGGFAEGAIPYGYRTIDGALEPIPEHAVIVKRMFEEARDGDTPGRIARGLNREGIPSPRGSDWTPKVVRGILRNPVYAGELHGVKRAQPAIISRRLFNAAQAALQKRSR